MPKHKAIFLDRDGTINRDTDYLYKREDFEFLPGAVEALSMLRDAGYLLLVITNQSGIARGYYTEQDYHLLNAWMLETLRSQGVDISGTYFCPHHPEAVIRKYRMNCTCRKPKTGLYEKAMADFDIDPGTSYAIGDKIRDCSLCERTDCRGFLIASNEEPGIIRDVQTGKIRNVAYAADLKEAAERICQG